jgi:CRISPR system Cascade subunit CasE
VLFRVEADRQPPRLLVLSPYEADWERCFAGQTILSGPADQKQIAFSLRPGQVLRFFLRANPTVRRLRFDASSAAADRLISGQRVGLLRQEEQLDWLRRRSDDAGFELLTVNVRDRGHQISFKPSTRSRLVHHCVDFEGRLRVTDPDRLLAAVGDGIGSGKGFGFGLLSLAPAGGP